MHNAALLLAEQELGDDYGAAEKTIAANQYDDIYDRIYKEIIKFLVCSRARAYLK
jgi:hypothetical protein